MTSLPSPKRHIAIMLPILVVASLLATACDSGTADTAEEETLEEGSIAGVSTTTAASALATGGATANSEIGAALPPTDPDALGMFFPKQERPIGDAPLAVLSGRLFVDDAGCPRVISGSGDGGIVPVWPFDYGLGTEDGEIYVLDGEGNVVARVGGDVYTSGGEVGTSLEGIAIVGEQTRRDAHERCPGNYWIVGNEVRPL